MSDINSVSPMCYTVDSPQIFEKGQVVSDFQDRGANDGHHMKTLVPEPGISGRDK